MKQSYIFGAALNLLSGTNSCTSLEKKSPAIVEFFKNFQLTADDVSLMAYQISVEKKQPADVARAWMKANKSTVDGWLGL